MRVEHEYNRCGALAYMAAWDVHRARIFGRCEESTGILPFNRLVDQVMHRKPYRSANRVFWIMDNGSVRLHVDPVTPGSESPESSRLLSP